MICFLCYSNSGNQIPIYIMRLKAAIATPALLLSCLCALAISSVSSARAVDLPVNPPEPLARCTRTEDRTTRTWYCDYGSCTHANGVKCNQEGSGSNLICECKPYSIGDEDPEVPGDEEPEPINP